MVAREARVVGTPHSTFSWYVQDVLWRLNRGLDIEERSSGRNLYNVSRTFMNELCGTKALLDENLRQFLFLVQFQVSYDHRKLGGLSGSSRGGTQSS